MSKYNLSPQPLIVVNKAGGAGAEGFLYVKGKKGDPHVIIITLSKLFTTPLATGAPFSWTDFTPLARLALDEFVLWVNAESPYTTAAAYLQAAKDQPGKFKMGGTGTAQEDQIITVQLEQATGTRFIYVPFRGGGDVATNLVGKHVDSTVNNPNEAVGHWKAGRLRPLPGTSDSVCVRSSVPSRVPPLRGANTAAIVARVCSTPWLTDRSRLGKSISSLLLSNRHGDVFIHESASCYDASSPP